MTGTAVRTSARRFADGLREALHDAGHEIPTGSTESHVRLIHYWDTDCLVVPALGFLAARRPTADDDRLVHALFSAGFLGNVHLVPAHRVELVSVLREWIDSHNPRIAQYPYELRDFVREMGLQSLLADLTRTVKLIVNDSDSPQLREGIRRLIEVDRRTFADVESLTGTWPARIANLLSGPSPLARTLGDDDDSHGIYSPTTSEIAANDLFREFTVALNDKRHGRRTEQTSIDATALTWVALVAQHAQSTKNGIYPRFYTSSRTIQEIFRDEQFAQDAFAVTYKTTYGIEVTGTIWRDSYSYLLRAVLPVLMPPDSRRERLNSGPTLDELLDLSRVLDEALDSGDAELQRRVSEIVFSDGSRLDDLIHSLESSAMGLVWLRYPINEQAQLMVSGLRSIARLSGLDESFVVAGEYLAESASRLNKTASDLATQVQTTARLIAAWRRVKTRMNSAGVSGISVLNDLGSIRWGVRSVGDADWLVSSISTSEPPVEELLGANEIHELREDAAKAERALAVLLGFDLYSDAERLSSQLLSGSREFKQESLWIMHKASVVRSNGKKASFDTRQFFDQLRERFDKLSHVDRQRLCLGYGYCGFFAWRYSIPEVIMEFSPVDPRGWARWSVRIVERHLNSWSGADRRFALNHIVYVAAVAGLSIPKHEEYVAELQIGPTSDAGRFRFDDTLGYMLYLEALRGINRKTFAEAPQLELWLERYGSSLSRGVELLNRAHNFAPNDREVNSHLRRARDLERVSHIRLEAR